MDRKADIFIVSPSSQQTSNILLVLELRQAEIRSRPASSQDQDEEAVILDKGACSRVQKLLSDEYMLEPETVPLTQQVWQRAVHLARELRKRESAPATENVIRAA